MTIKRCKFQYTGEKNLCISPKKLCIIELFIIFFEIVILLILCMFKTFSDYGAYEYTFNLFTFCTIYRQNEEIFDTTSKF